VTCFVLEIQNGGLRLRSDESGASVSWRNKMSTRIPRMCGRLHIFKSVDEVSVFVLVLSFYWVAIISEDPFEKQTLGFITYDNKSHLADATMHALMHWSLRLVFVPVGQALACMRLLNTWVRRLESCKVDCIRIHEHFRDRTNVCDQAVNHVQGEALTHYHSKDFRLFLIRRQRVIYICQPRNSPQNKMILTRDDVLFSA
jgi:hypothetical protein